MDALALKEGSWPLEGIKTTAIFKAVNVDISYHKACCDKAGKQGEPYTQISINGFVLVDGQGCVLFANIQINEEYGFTENVRQIKETFTEGALLWLNSDSFAYGDREVLFYEPQFKPVGPNDYGAVNSFFPTHVADGDQPSDDEFYYAGGIYREGRGRLLRFAKCR